MVIGNGMIAKSFSRFADDADRLVFASGVSDSSCTDENKFKRESDLLLAEMSKHPDAQVIYFSTCSIYDPSLHESAYVMHKLRMEDLIKSVAAQHIIFRVSNPVGVTQNHHTLINYFVEHIVEQLPFSIWKYASRNLIDIDDMTQICQLVIYDKNFNNRTVNVANPVNYPVSQIVEAIEHHLGKKGNYDLIEKGNSPLIDTTEIQHLYSRLHIDFGNDYLDQLLKKYYPN